ncbi:hypothetical protein [Cellulomonas fimi]|jgi:hypothetical protein|uniref:hypothetical protein n=1 Tax=Cellulomonas fimi TaxID=1708 RepID=UPI002359ABD8|nr:hypothetical protein [Cellulomonas fimi]
MARDPDAVLLESVRVHRARLRAAFLHGDLRDRRTTNDNVRRFVGSVVVAALACAGCAGYSFVQANSGSLRGGPTSPQTTIGTTP